MDELFDLPPPRQKAKKSSPLADRMRPQTLDEVIGQEAIIGPESPLKKQIDADQLPSLIFWGPPGSGKTTLARVIARQTKASFHALSAVLDGVKELREVIETAKKDERLRNQKTILFVDEIHRWNKAQQDALLPHIEDGTLILIGATTENPSFEIIAPLLSRLKIYVLTPLTVPDLQKILKKALIDSNQGIGSLKRPGPQPMSNRTMETHLTSLQDAEKRESKTLNLQMTEEALDFMVQTADGDARRALNTLEVAANLVLSSPKKDREITLPIAEQALQKKSLLYDKSGEEHYNLISAFIKSMRGSDPDAAVYWLARMLEAGEDPLFLARRMVIFASEDIGNADPQAIQVAVSVLQAYDFVGMPEGWIPLAQAATYLASAPKSNASYMAYLKAKGDIEKEGPLPTPLHIRNAPTTLMKSLGYGRNYQYPHDFESHIVQQDYLPEKLKGKIYYEPSENGYEAEIRRYLERTKKSPVPSSGTGLKK